ncbi:MAG: hypothetical protein L6Q76_05935 [Polyangiaceae bacterium]|nr:hypothetical protein [Polyangiaceae bacterium]
MRARIQALSLAALTLLTSAGARADILPPGEKGVKLSIRVDGAIAAGKALVLDRTFRGADVIPAGQVVPVEWHPMGGPMRLVLVDADAAAKVEKLRENMERDAIKSLTSAGTPCSDPFDGVRTVPTESPAAEVRWTFSVKVEGTSCTGTLVRTEQLAKDGSVVSATPASAPTGSVVPAVSKTSEPASSPATPTPPAASKSGCAVNEINNAEGAGVVFLLGLGAITALRRRRNHFTGPRS